MLIASGNDARRDTELVGQPGDFIFGTACTDFTVMAGGNQIFSGEPVGPFFARLIAAAVVDEQIFLTVV